MFCNSYVMASIIFIATIYILFLTRLFQVLPISLIIMSGWQAYITNLLDSSEGIKRAAIIGLDGSVWARSDGANEFKVSFLTFSYYIYIILIVFRPQKQN